jgi:RNA polymerase sigma factor FliA
MTATGSETHHLIEQHQGLVRSIASRIHRRIGDRAELDDLVAYGQVGLAEAARDFDPARGGAFSTFAYYRIRGAIYDGISKLCWTSRARYNRVRYEQMANEVLSSEVERSETDAATPDSLHADANWLGRVTDALAVVYLGAHAGGVAQTTASRRNDREPESPSEELELKELGAKLRELVDTLPLRTATLIRAAYFEGLSLQEAGRRMGISKSWASRLHAQALDELARSLRAMGMAE